MIGHAYNEIYLNVAMETLAETFSYVSDSKSADEFFQYFIMSGVAYQFERGNPRYVNMPSHVLFEESVKGRMKLRIPYSYGRSPQYWCGFVLAYYQWYTGLSFKRIGEKLPPSRIINMYNPLHEASLEKFVEVANSIMYEKVTNLAIYRKRMNLSQIELSRYSGVSLRSIQLYEQRQLDINEAPSIKLFKLSRILGCSIEDLLEIKLDNK